MSCCLVRLSNEGLGPPDETAFPSLPACTQQSIYRGAAEASRLDPLAFSGDGRSKALLFAVLNGTSITDLEPANFSCDPENWAFGQSASNTSAKDMISARISFPGRAAIVHFARFSYRTCCARLESPDALGDDSSLFAVTQQQWRACVRRMPRCKLACTLPSSSPDPR